MGLTITDPNATFEHYVRLNPTANFDFLSSTVDTIAGRSLTTDRASVASYIGADGLVHSAAAGVPRLDHHPTTLAPRGLLVEAAATNVLAESEDVGAWVLLVTGGATANVTVTAGARQGPDGELSLAKVSETSANSAHYIRSGYVPMTAPSGYVTDSRFVAAGERTRIEYGLSQTGSVTTNVLAEINLETGEVISISGGTGTARTKWYEACQCWRIEITAPAAPGMTGVRAAIALRDGAGNSSYVGVAGSGIYMGAMQLEDGARATSYIKTAGAAGARAVDNIYLDGSALAAVVGDAGGALVAHGEAGIVTAVAGTRTIAALTDDDGDDSNSVWLGRSTTNRPFGAVNDAVSADPTRTWAGNVLGVGLAYAANDHLFAVDGTRRAIVGAQPLIAPERLQVGARFAGVDVWGGWVRDLSVYAIRPADIALALATT